MESDGEQYALNWSNHSNHLKRAFGNVFGSHEFCDVTLSVEGKSIRAHKIVLSACSTYFQQVFREHSTQATLVILIKDVEYKMMMDILRFMYLGEVQIANSKINAFLAVAELLQITGLSNEPDDDYSEEICFQQNETLPIRREVPQSSTSPPASTKVKKQDTTESVKRGKVSEAEESPSKKKLKVRNASSSSEDESPKPISTPVKKSPTKSLKKSLNKSMDNEKRLGGKTAQEILSDTSYLDPALNPRHECPVCGKSTSTMYNLKSHVSVHLGDNSCSYCNMTFKRADYLRQHQKRIHNLS